eukprot:TRINITY_DN114376_c0_g1_i1.p1 TRINITY_DN114376_c0_g1~~TRINITY_DN114376_c0_g1_i1.p1  ORF type:complete len:358 (+),score=51.06 TRINITY_DN114376_c0_g1_i1:64-1137(+)
MVAKKRKRCGDSDDAASCAGNEPPRSFPTLPKDHPLCTVPMDTEHGAVWFNCPFAADACIIVDSSHYFIHEAYVAKESEYFKTLLAKGKFSREDLYSLRLDALPAPECFKWLLKYMYTKNVEILRPRSTFGYYQVAKYLMMYDEIFGLLEERYALADPDSDLQPEMEAKYVPLTALKRILSILDAKQRPLHGDKLLKFLLHWARTPEDVGGNELATVKEMLNGELPKCSPEGVSMASTTYAAAFDALVSPTELWKRMSPKRDHFALRCKSCRKEFHTVSSLTSDRCTRVKLIHSAATFTSKTGRNTCCSSCMKPLYHAGCISVKEAVREHNLETIGGKYALQISSGWCSLLTSDRDI